MNHKAVSIRPFIGSKDFQVSKNFYSDLGFEEVSLGDKMSYFKTGSFGFYLQDYYAKDWVDNTMVFLEVDDVDDYWNQLTALGLDKKYDNVKVVPIRIEDWGKECFLVDPAGILWHFGEFKK
ncbi:MAG: glyoxalase [Flavobacterium sp.]|nr:MAG: glyoxalase [Flavobacterium sp.]